ncbi:MAG: right-handed parallel beta-helix repeat-containing protein [Dehalococcoidia bacterium]|nr:right-handed parallel beta-helix repeat-containing protein [Dehalococcoidia bacterium]
MKPNKLWLLLIASALILSLVACAPGPLPGEEAPPTPTPPEKAIPFLHGKETKVGRLGQNETWSGEIFIPGMVQVPQGVTLTIEPGTVIKFRHSRDYKNLGRGTLVVNGGTLKAIGTPEEPIWFTSDAEEPINGDWEGIAIENSKGENIIKYSIVECSFIGIRFWTSSGTVANSIVRWINAEGIYMERSNVVLENNMIYGTGYNGIAMEQFNDVIIKNNKIINNQGSGIHGEATKAVIENNIIRNSRTGITFDDFSEAVLRNNLIEDIRNEALHFYFNSTGNLLFNEVRNSGLAISSFGSRLIVNSNDIYDNTRNIEIHSMQEVDLRENWWGTTDKNSIKEKINSDTEVSFEPFLDREGVSIQEPVFDYQDVKKTELGYIPGDPEDKYPYIYADEDETRRVVKKICGEKEGFSECGFGWSLAWDGRYLWRTRHAGSGDLVKVDPESGKVVASFENPGIAQDRGLAFDGKSLWVNDFSALKVFEIDPETGRILSSFKIPEMGSGSSGIAWDGQYLYLVDWLKRDQPGAPLYKVDRQGNLIDIIELEEAGGASITFDGQYFWISPAGRGIRKFDKRGNLVGEIYAAAFGGEAIAHDGKYLWVLHRTQELWNEPKLYQIEVIDDQILLK